MFNSREKLQKAINEKNWLEIVKADKSDWYWLNRNAYPSLVYEAATQDHWDIVEYVINTFKRDYSGELDYRHVCEWILWKNRTSNMPDKCLLIAKQILANNPEFAWSLFGGGDDPIFYLNASTRVKAANAISREIATVIKQGVWLLSILDNFEKTNFKDLKDVMPAIIRYALVSLIYSLHRQQSTIFYSQVIRDEHNNLVSCPLVTHSDIDTIIRPYMDFRSIKYTENARQLVKSQSGGFFGCLGKSSDTTIFVKRLGSMLEAHPKDIKNYIHDFVKNRYIKGNGSEKNIIPALIAHNLITQKKVDEFKKEAVAALMDGWEDIGQTSNLSRS